MNSVRAIALALLLPLHAAAAPATEDEESEKTWWVPTHIQLQYAGNIGWISAGPGFSWWKDRVQFALLLGYVPAFVGGPITGIATRLTLAPAKIDLGRDFYLRPLRMGGLLHYTFGADYFLTLPDRYPPGYYDISTALRIAAFVGASVGTDEDLLFIDRTELYLELGTTDLELFLHLDNPDSRPLFDATHLALGFLFWF